MTEPVSLPSGITLHADIAGDAARPTVIPILGITDNITDWPPSLTDPLIAAGYRVVRFELRDMGLSTKLEQAGVPDLDQAAEQLASGQIPKAAYTMHDVAEDLLQLMDVLVIEQAHLIGYSYGGAVAQLAALAAPDRVLSMTCLQGTNYNPALSPRRADVAAALAGACRRYETEHERIDAITRLRLACNGTSHAMDEREARASATESVSRAYYPDGTARLILSRLATPPFFEDTSAISASTLVLHGSNDPILPLDHGEDIAARIPGARLQVLHGAGHNHPESLKPLITAALIEFLNEL